MKISNDPIVDKSLTGPLQNLDNSTVIINSHHGEAQTMLSASLLATDIKSNDQDIPCSDDILTDSQNIPLMRIFMSKKQTKPYEAKVGGRLDDIKAIVLYKGDSSSRFYREIPLSEILDVKYVSDSNLENTAHFFEIRARTSEQPGMMS
ncbi:unnamed protein product [Cercopithifilaria johnstoni]|uniref:Uncharacterized protein n=1 Tax=Cercopithifilaria johnstoni TaxID=2874296 RepID=A0A8J2PYP7_9BILA|nr:unnamed protein product [Cercopithifilaria johnstoni]